MKKYRVEQEATISRWCVVEDYEENMSKEDIRIRAIEQDCWHESEDDYEWEATLVEEETD